MEVVHGQPGAAKGDEAGRAGQGLSLTVRLCMVGATMEMVRITGDTAGKSGAARVGSRHSSFVLLCALVCGLCGSGKSLAQADWTQKVFFENSISPRAYFYSDARVSAPSTLELVGKLLPVDTSNFVSGP